MRAPLLAAALWLASAIAVAQPAGDPAPLQFADAQQEARFQSLTSELRCVQCQNQSLADSNAQIAHDLRREVLVMMQQGRSDAQIKQFLVERYGPFVLYRPQWQAGTALLWLGPGLLLLAGAATLVLYVRRRMRRLPPPAAGDAPDQERDW